MKITPIFLLLTAVAAVAVEPNFVRTTVYTVGKDGSGNDADLVSTTYSDGLGRQIQSKVKVSATQDRTACTFYDDAGRPEFSTKTFINSGTYAGVYLPGDLATLNGTGGALRDQYSTDTKPYSYTKYSEDRKSVV